MQRLGEVMLGGRCGKIASINSDEYFHSGHVPANHASQHYMYVRTETAETKI